MNNTVYNVDFTRALPQPLKNDESMLALGRAIAGELQQNIQLARLTLIYQRIDELDETLLDILARDLHVDWYNDTYPIAAKRAIIKSSVQIHKRLGTKYAVVKALGDLFPNSEVQEWFEYGGTHHRFRIILDLTNAKAPLDLLQIVSAAKFYKRLSAHLEEVVYQMSAVIEIHTGTAYFRYSIARTNTYRAGTRPRRNTVGGVSGATVDIYTDSISSAHKFSQAGTKPYRSTLAELNGVSIAAQPETQAYKDISGYTGRYSAGDSPHRNTGGGTSQSAVEVQAGGDNYRFASEQSGKTPARSTEYTTFDNSVSAEITADSFLYTADMTAQNNAGEKPHTNSTGETDEGGVTPTVTAEGFSFSVKRCGTSVAKNNKKG